jgi:malate synthase
MTAYVDRDGLRVDPVLADFLEQKALPDTGVSVADFWSGFSALIHEKGPKNRALVAKREAIQEQIDSWHVANRGKDHDAVAYKAFLTEIGYLVPEGADFAIETENVDPEIAAVPGPQLVVPIMNARFALNAANARWGSLYDALYGTDALGSLAPKGGYDAEHGAKAVAWGRKHLDDVTPLAEGSWADITDLSVTDGVLVPALKDPKQFVGGNADDAGLTDVFLRANGLLIGVIIDPESNIGKTDKAGIADIMLESALSVIMDCEDSVAAVDGADKVVAYTNWLGLMQGTLTETVTKGGETYERVLNDDIGFTGVKGHEIMFKGRALMLIRNVGHLMTNPAILDRDGNEAGEGLMDAMITTMIAIHDLKRQGGNSVTGSVYIVKPKMHGPEEVAFADEIFSAVEAAL